MGKAVGTVENSKLIKLEEEINGIFEGTLEEDESDVKDIHNYIYMLQVHL
jgi:hypothetical protein